MAGRVGSDHTSAAAGHWAVFWGEGGAPGASQPVDCRQPADEDGHEGVLLKGRQQAASAGAPSTLPRRSLSCRAQATGTWWTAHGGLAGGI